MISFDATPRECASTPRSQRAMLRCAVALLLVLVPAKPAGAAVLPSSVESAAQKDSFARGDAVTVWGSRVGPFSNPLEFYAYHTLPWCQRPEWDAGGPPRKPQSLGEQLGGYPLELSAFDLRFRVNQNRRLACTRTLGQQDVAAFRKAVEENWSYQLYIGDLPVWGFVGKIGYTSAPQAWETGSMRRITSLFSAVHFEVHHNRGRVIQIEVSTNDTASVDISADVTETEVDFVYSVTWRETTRPFDERFDKYSRSAHLSSILEVRWTGIINNCACLVVLILTLARAAMRAPASDAAPHGTAEQSGDQERPGLLHRAYAWLSSVRRRPQPPGPSGQLRGWRAVKHALFRPPSAPQLLAAIVGGGSHLAAVTAALLLLGVCGMFHPYDRGMMLAALLILYVALAPLAGLAAASCHRQMGSSGKQAVTAALTCIAFSAVFWCVFAVNDSVAVSFQSAAAVPRQGILRLVLASGGAAVLTAAGGLGCDFLSNRAVERDRGLLEQDFSHKALPVPWWRGPVVQMVFSGIIVFGSMFLEEFFVLATLFGHEVYTDWQILCVVFALTLAITALTNVLLTHKGLSRQDHRWQRKAVLCGGSAAIWTYGHCVYYYFVRTHFSGVIQLTWFFTYTALLCWGVWLTLGAVGCWASWAYIRLLCMQPSPESAGVELLQHRLEPLLPERQP